MLMHPWWMKSNLKEECWFIHTSYLHYWPSGQYERNSSLEGWATEVTGSLHLSPFQVLPHWINLLVRLSILFTLSGLEYWRWEVVCGFVRTATDLVFTFKATVKLKEHLILSKLVRLKIQLLERTLEMWTDLVGRPWRSVHSHVPGHRTESETLG